MQFSGVIFKLGCYKLHWVMTFVVEGLYMNYEVYNVVSYKCGGMTDENIWASCAL